MLARICLRRWVDLVADLVAGLVGVSVGVFAGVFRCVSCFCRFRCDSFCLRGATLSVDRGDGIDAKRKNSDKCCNEN